VSAPLRFPPALTALAAFVVFAVFAAPPCFAAVAWPVDKPFISGTFGEDRGDHFDHGVDFAGAGQAGHPALDGELVFRWEGPREYSSLPRGTGALVVLRHSQNILSMYAHLAEGSLGPARARYAAGDTLGLVGDTGLADVARLSFSVYDGEARSWVNPLAFLPPVPDRQPPVIRRVVIAVGDQRLALASGARVKEGRAVILAEAYDLREDVRFHWSMAPYVLRLSLDGAQVSRIAFDSLSVRDGRMTLGPAGPGREQLYASDGLLSAGTVDLRTGESRLLLTVSDFAGNETSREIVLSVSAGQ
jgi:hypothetical protein